MIFGYAVPFFRVVLVMTSTSGWCRIVDMVQMLLDSLRRLIQSVTLQVKSRSLFETDLNGGSVFWSAIACAELQHATR